MGSDQPTPFEIWHYRLLQDPIGFCKGLLKVCVHVIALIGQWAGVYDSIDVKGSQGDATATYSEHYRTNQLPRSGAI